MYITQPFTIEGDVIESARQAVLEAFEEKGYPPNEVMVHPTADIGGNAFIAVMLGGEMHQIPLRKREDLKIGFGLKDNQGLLDVCDPNDTRE